MTKASHGWLAFIKIRSSIPIAFGVLVGIALRLKGRCDPHGTRRRRQFPMTCHPLILFVAPCPVACDPHIIRTRLSQHDVGLERRRSYGHNGRSCSGRSRRHYDIARGSGSLGGHGVRGGGGRCGRHRAGWHGRWRRANRVRLGCVGATGQETERAATGDDGCVLLQSMDGS